MYKPYFRQKKDNNILLTVWAINAIVEWFEVKKHEENLVAPKILQLPKFN